MLGIDILIVLRSTSSKCKAVRLQYLIISSYYNEDEVGSALRDFLANNPSVKRSDIFVTTKVWPHLSEPEDVEWSFNESLKNLGVDYVDSFLIHWPFTAEKTDANDVKLGPDGKVCPQENHLCGAKGKVVHHKARAHNEPRACLARVRKALQSRKNEVNRSIELDDWWVRSAIEMRRDQANSQSSGDPPILAKHEIDRILLRSRYPTCRIFAFGLPASGSEHGRESHHGSTIECYRQTNGPYSRTVADRVGFEERICCATEELG